MAGPRQVVDGPGFTPLPYGLWDAAEHPAWDGPHWQNGITWQDRCPVTGGTVYDECIAVTGTGGAPAPQVSMSSNTVQTNRGATAFTVYAEFDCSPIGQDPTDKAQVALARVESSLVEAAFWTGVSGAAAGPTPQTTVWPHLAANALLVDPQNITLQFAASPLVTGGVDAATALGSLEGALASCYGNNRGVVHVPRSVLPSLAAAKQLDYRTETDPRSGNATGKALYTRAGNRLVVGGGYPGTSPSGTAPAAGTSWIYATGAVFAQRSEVNAFAMPGILDRAENTMRWTAQRTYLVGYECCLYGALVKIGTPFA